MSRCTALCNGVKRATFRHLSHNEHIKNISLRYEDSHETDPYTSADVGCVRLLLFLVLVITDNFLFLHQVFESVISSRSLLSLASQHGCLVHLLLLKSRNLGQVLTILHNAHRMTLNVWTFVVTVSQILAIDQTNTVKALKEDTRLN